MATKTINLTGAEVAVTGLDGAHAHIRNDGTEVIYAAKTAGITAGADGVASIPAGQSDTIRGISGAVYLLGTGSVLIQSDDYVASPFKTSATSGGSGADEVARAAINEHSGNAEVHVTAEEKAAWDGKAELTDIPTTLPADGGNADTLDGKHASDFADNIYKGYPERGDCNNATAQGVYTLSNNSTNAPGSGFYMLTVDVAGDGAWIVQTAFSVSLKSEAYRRMKVNGVWGEWYNIADGGNAASVGAYTEAKLAELEARIAALEGGTT